MMTALCRIPALRMPLAASAFNRPGNASPPIPSEPTRRKFRRDTPSQNPEFAGRGPKMESMRKFVGEPHGGNKRGFDPGADKSPAGRFTRCP